jgi:hypothetical protein
MQEKLGAWMNGPTVDDWLLLDDVVIQCTKSLHHW